MFNVLYQQYKTQENKCVTLQFDFSPRCSFCHYQFEITGWFNYMDDKKARIEHNSILQQLNAVANIHIICIIRMISTAFKVASVYNIKTKVFIDKPNFI